MNQFEINEFSQNLLSENQDLYRLIYSTDASLYRYIPESVVKPQDIEEIKKLFDSAQKTNKYITFRAAGTSLSGQALGESILADISKSFKNIDVLEDGKYIKAEVGVVAGRLNQALAKYGRKIGPDPASINSAMVGGILANNSSGMSSGIENNPYNAIKAVEFMLPNGHYYDTSRPDAYIDFKTQDYELFEFLATTRDTIKNTPNLLNRINTKYELKNTIGYSINAFTDYYHPLDILAHLLIGSEGTLAFIKSATFKTIPLNPLKSTGIIFFDSLYNAATSIPLLKELEFNVIEIIDSYCLQSFDLIELIPEDKQEQDLSAILVEFQCESLEELKVKESNFYANLEKIKIHYFKQLNREADVQSKLWKIRKGLLAKVGAIKPKGTTLIVEDIAFRIEDLPNALNDLRRLLDKFNYSRVGIYGHGTDGNIHFLLSQDFSNGLKVEQYSDFMNELAELVINKYNGSLKAEHGTGRNMAPFVEQEWGEECYQIMKEIKNIIDPDTILNRGVLINEDPQIHLKNIKQNAVLNNESDKCIECGFCESVCPSKDLTVSPRQRISIQRMESTGILKKYNISNESINYFNNETCATDSLCSVMCPVGIDTGKIVKEIRSTEVKHKNSTKENYIVKQIKGNPNTSFQLIEYLLKLGVYAIYLVNQSGINLLVNEFVKGINRLFNTQIPNIPDLIFAPSKSGKNVSNDFSVILFPSCHSRLLGNNDNSYNINEDYQQVFDKLQINYYSDEFNSLCCGMAFDSKGYSDIAKLAENSINDKVNSIISKNTYKNKTQIQLIFNSSSCLNHYLMFQNFDPKTSSYSPIDIYEYLYDYLIENRSKIPQKKLEHSIFLHLNCASIKADNSWKLESLLRLFNQNVTVLKEGTCCGTAGDKFLIMPENVHFANIELTKFLENNKFDFYLSNNTTCEYGLSLATDVNFISFISYINLVL